ncbi:MAG TPA: hypothetical protein V8P47_00185 [Candidatus Azosocius sp. HAIN]
MSFFNCILILILSTILGTFFYKKTDYIFINFSQWNIQIPLWFFIIILLIIFYILYFLMTSNFFTKKNNKYKNN